MKNRWKSSKSEVLFNPRLSSEEKNRAKELIVLFPEITGHFWIATSGSTGEAKWTALSKSAILASAKAVNAHLESNNADIWLNALPDFHVSGLGMTARAFLSGASILDYKVLVGQKWQAQAFHTLAIRFQATLTALVPAQVYDLVALQLPAPPSLRAVIVGGGRLEDSLYQKAVQLGWRLLPSYGLTESASQVATAELSSMKALSPLKVLPHWNVKISKEGFICLRGPALLSGYAVQSEGNFHFFDPKVEGWLQTEDLGELQDGYLHIKGRTSNFIKVGGESVDITFLENMLSEIKLAKNWDSDVAIIAAPNERLGHVIHLLCTVAEEEIQPLLELFNSHVRPFERIRQVHSLSHLPRTPLGKLCKKQLLQLIPDVC